MGFSMKGIKGLNENISLPTLCAHCTHACSLLRDGMHVPHVIIIFPSATKSNEQFHPNPQVPALQYICAVAKGGAAEVAGLKQGDFLIEVKALLHS